MGIIGTVLCRFPGTPVDKNKITHTQACSFSRAPIHVFQRGVEQFRFLSLRKPENRAVSRCRKMACQRDGAIALLRLGGPARHTFCLCRNSSVLFTVRVLAFQSMASHVSPITSPVRSPVSKIKAYCAWLWERLAASINFCCSSVVRHLMSSTARTGW